MSSTDNPKLDEDEVEGLEDNDEPTETIATGRAKRSRAGALMAGLLTAEANAEDDDQIAAIFAEEEDDEEFDSTALEAAGEGEDAEGGEEGDDDEDMRMDTDSDDDENDQGPPTGQEEDYEGEVELRKQDRAERMAKKRKAHEDLKVMAMRKRVKVQSRGAQAATAATPAPRPKKKSERISWLPTPEEGPVRASSRRQTMQNKELTHARLKDSEEKRVRLIATMEEAARRKEKLKPKEMTQEDRLAEAAKTERLNSKSVNRWEEMEKKKSEEQKAKLEALQNRKLEGPVLSWWSGVAKWINGKLSRVGNFAVTQVPEKETTRRKKVNAESKKAEKASAEPKVMLPVVVPSPAPSGQSDTPSKGQEGTPVEQQQPPQKQITFAPPQNPENFLDGIHLYASMPAETSKSTEATEATGAISTTPAQQTQQQPSKPEQPEQSQPGEQEQPPVQTQAKTEAQPDASQLEAQPPSNPQPETQLQSKPESQPGSRLDLNPSQPEEQPAPPTPMDIDKPAITTTTTDTAHTTQPAPAPSSPIVEKSTRNLIILENFENTTSQDRASTAVLFNPSTTSTSTSTSRKLAKVTKPPAELCVITSQPARYRDPETGLPYANAYAYREIRRLLGNQFGWSGMLGCFVGPVGFGARGVPDRFLDPESGKEKGEKVVEEATA